MLLTSPPSIRRTSKTVTTSLWHTWGFNRDRQASSLLIILGLCSLSLSLGGCVAQQADLARIQKDLETQITKIKEEKRALDAQVNEARSAIMESQEILANQKADIAKMQHDLAPRTEFANLSQQIKLIREQDLASLYGKHEVAEKRLNDLEKSLAKQSESAQSEIGSLQTMVQTQGEQLREQNEQIKAAQVQNNTLAQEVDLNNQTLTTTMAEFQQSLGQFKGTLGDLGTKFGQHHEEITAQQATVSAHEDQLRTIEGSTRELSQTLVRLREVVEQSGTLLGGRIDEQTDQVAQLKQDMADLQQKLNSDTQALRTYLEQDVQMAITQLGKDVETQQRPLIDRLNAFQKDIENLGTHVQADAVQVQELAQTVVKLREAQDVMGSLLGKRGDEIIQQAGRLTERVNLVESHQAELAKQLQGNTQKTESHLNEVNASLESVAQALAQTSQSLTTRLAKQEETLHTLTQTAQQVEQLKRETAGQNANLKAAADLTDQLGRSVEQIAAKLHDLEQHHSGLVDKLDSDAQSTTGHLQDVNKSIQSVAQALESVSGKLHSRIQDQEQRLNRALTNFQKVQGTAEMTQTNLNHLNRLTETVNQIREVVNTIGTKLGERVDEHEDRLGNLAQRVNQLQSIKAKK
jgi:chromosome segregation ATPase